MPWRVSLFTEETTLDIRITPGNQNIHIITEYYMLSNSH